MKSPVVKICCIESLAEAQAAVAEGASAIGLVSSMPSGPGVIPDTLIATIAAGVGGTAESFLLTSRLEAEGIVEQHRRCRTATIQLVDHVAHAELSRRIRDSVTKPVNLAGGLNAQNIHRAVEAVRPFGMDLCSGVRTDGRLDPGKLRTFFDAIDRLGT